MKFTTIVLVGMLLPAPAGADPEPNRAASAPARAASAAPKTRPSPFRVPLEVPSAARRRPPIGVAPLPVTVPAAPLPPVFTSVCDSSGCWGSDGSRTNAAGGMLVRPDGKICQNVAGVLQCP